MPAVHRGMCGWGARCFGVTGRASGSTLCSLCVVLVCCFFVFFTSLCSKGEGAQTDLFGAMPAPTAPADPGVTRLKVLPRGREKLSPAQQRFNKLLARVDILGRQVQNIQRLGDAVRAPHLERVSALERRIT